MSDLLFYVDESTWYIELPGLPLTIFCIAFYKNHLFSGS